MMLRLRQGQVSLCMKACSAPTSSMQAEEDPAGTSGNNELCTSVHRRATHHWKSQAELTQRTENLVRQADHCGNPRGVTDAVVSHPGCPRTSYISPSLFELAP